ncbi:hypothetical protein PTI98_008006 [Pleurotus ostreatus]|nr:hypothetical protein PTI98_008006 [Pleurotus ostreatus]
MTSLGHLELVDIPISAELSLLPRLTYLKLWAAATASLLLVSKQHSSKLEELDVSGVVKDESPILRVELPNLSRISIVSRDLGASAIFAKINYPFSARVHFNHSHHLPAEPDFSHLAKLCAWLADPGGLAISKAIIRSGSRRSGTIPPFVESLCFNYLSFELDIEPHYQYPAWCCASSSPLIPELMKASNDSPPLPELRTVYLWACNLHPNHDGRDTTVFNALGALLKERKHIMIPVGHMAIRMCSKSLHKLNEKMSGFDKDGGRTRRKQIRLGI